jgi:hypothetical protein
MTQGEQRAVELEKLVRALEERIESLRRDLARAEEDWRSSGTPVWREQIALVSGRIDLVHQDLGHTKNDLKELKAIRWEIWKMVLTPLISAVVSAIVSATVASLVINRSLGPAIEQTPKSPARKP